MMEKMKFFIFGGLCSALPPKPNRGVVHTKLAFQLLGRYYLVTSLFYAVFIYLETSGVKIMSKKLPNRPPNRPNVGPSSAPSASASSHRLNLSLSDEVFRWLQKNADYLGTSPTTYATMVLMQTMMDEKLKR